MWSNTYLCVTIVDSSPFDRRTTPEATFSQRVVVIFAYRTHSAVSSNRVECSLNFLIRGSTAFCFPACIVTSFSLPVYSQRTLAYLNTDEQH